MTLESVTHATPFLTTLNHLSNQKRKHMHQRLSLLHVRDVQNVHREHRHYQRGVTRRDLQNRAPRRSAHTQGRDPVFLGMRGQGEQGPQEFHDVNV